MAIITSNVGIHPGFSLFWNHVASLMLGSKRLWTLCVGWKWLMHTPRSLLLKWILKSLILTTEIKPRKRVFLCVVIQCDIPMPMSSIYVFSYCKMLLAFSDIKRITLSVHWLNNWLWILKAYFWLHFIVKVFYSLHSNWYFLTKISVYNWHLQTPAMASLVGGHFPPRQVCSTHCVVLCSPTRAFPSMSWSPRERERTWEGFRVTSAARAGREALGPRCINTRLWGRLFDSL